MARRFLTNICGKIFNNCNKYLKRVSKTRKNEYNKKKICDFLFGIFLGIIFYELIIIDLDFAPYSALITGVILCLMLGFGTFLSVQIRCIAFLSLPILGGKAGRTVLKALILAYIVSGPIENLASNGREVVRVFSCSASLTINLTRSRFDLMIKPFQQGLFGMKTDVAEVKDTVRSIRGITAPLAGEIEDETEMRKMKEENDYLDAVQGDSKRSDEIDKKYNTSGEKIESERYRKIYLKKIETRCEDQLSRAGKKCRTMFGKAYDKCYNKVSWIAAWILCWPMKLTFVCNIIEALGGSKACDPAKNIDPGFGEGYAYLKNSRNALTQNFKDVKLQYKIGKIKHIDDIKNAADASKMVLHEVQKKKTFLDSILTIFKRILAFVFLKIIVDAQNYHNLYLQNIEYDNIYITSYFRKIDARRKASDKPSLLPLKKVEQLKLVDPLSPVPLKNEKESLLGNTCILLMEMIAATVFILLDRLFYELLDLIRRHARIDYTQVGHHDMNIDVRGAGMIASLLRNIVKGFNIKKRIRVVRSNVECLPQPIFMPTYYLYKIYGTYFLIWLTILFEAYVLRFRRVICSKFYRKREKKRIIFLYNETLKRRVGFFRYSKRGNMTHNPIIFLLHSSPTYLSYTLFNSSLLKHLTIFLTECRYMKRKIKSMVREQRLEEDLNFFKVIRIRYPKLCSWLNFFQCAKRNCIICKDIEGYNEHFIVCSVETCHVVYCPECWHDLGDTCYACAVDSLDDTASGESSNAE